MNRFWSRLFGKKQQPPVNSADMRSTPVDNPLDVREDGSIREGDPAWNFMMEVMNSGKAGVANQRQDGTWETNFFDGSSDEETPDAKSKTTP